MAEGEKQKESCGTFVFDEKAFMGDSPLESDNGCASRNQFVFKVLQGEVFCF